MARVFYDAATETGRDYVAKLGAEADVEVSMGQVTINLDRQTQDDARAAARAEGVSLSKWKSERIQRHAKSEWPAPVRDLAGASSDLPSAEDLRKSKTKDVARKRP